MPTAHGVQCRSVVLPSYKPLFAGQIVKHAVDSTRRTYLCACIRTLFERSCIGTGVRLNLDVPLIALPGVFPPPIARTAPRPGSRHHPAPNARKSNPRGAAL